MNFGPTSTSVSLSTLTSWIVPTMRRTLLQPTSWCSKRQQEVDNTQSLYGLVIFFVAVLVDLDVLALARIVAAAPDGFFPFAFSFCCG